MDDENGTEDVPPEANDDESSNPGQALIISPGWYATLNCSPFTASFEQQIAVWRNMTLDFPDIYFELVGVDADVNETYRTADVIMRTHMLQGDEKFLTACMLNFKLSDGKWSWYKHHGIRGIAEVD